MKKVLLAGVSAVVLGFAGTAAAQSVDGNINQTSTDNTDPDVFVNGGSDSTMAANVALQDSANLFDMDDEGFLIDGEYHGNLNFNDVFDSNVLTSAAWNSGINAAQQGGVAASGEINDTGAAVAANVLAQVSSNTIQDVDQFTEDGNDDYFGNQTFAAGAFDDTALNTYSFNSGVNASQQGAVALGLSAPTTP